MRHGAHPSRVQCRIRTWTMRHVCVSSWGYEQAGGIGGWDVRAMVHTGCGIYMLLNMQLMACSQVLLAHAEQPNSLNLPG